MSHRVGVDVGGTFTDVVRVGRTREGADDARGPERGCARGPRAARRDRGRLARGAARAHAHDRPRHDRRRQHDDPDDGRPDRLARHRGVPRRDRAAPLLQGGHLGPGVPAAGPDRQAAGPPRDPRTAHRRGRRRSPPRRGRGATRNATPARVRRDVDRDRVPALVRQPRARAASPRARARGVPRRRADLTVARGVPEAARVRAHVNHARERVRGAADRALRRAPRGAVARRRLHR